MTNLIPPHAKKQLVYAYWIRVVSAWALLWAVSLLVGLLLLWPTYLLISGTNQAYYATALTAGERTTIYDDMTSELAKANDQAKLVIINAQASRISTLLDDIWSQVGPGIAVSGIGINRTNVGVEPITISGEATNRQTLSTFRDQLAALPYVDGVDLPIENLAQNQDINFILTVTINQQAL